MKFITRYPLRFSITVSNTKLAEKLGVTQPMVAKLESGDYNYTIEQLWKIANKLGFAFHIEFKEREPESFSVIARPENEDHIVDYAVGYLAVGS